VKNSSVIKKTIYASETVLNYVDVIDCGEPIINLVEITENYVDFYDNGKPLRLKDNDSN